MSQSTVHATTEVEQGSITSRIVVAIDPHRQVDYAVSWAANFALATNASVHAVLVARNDGERKAMQDAATSVAGQLIAMGVDHEIDERYGIPGEIMTELGARSDLMVLAEASEQAGRSILGVVGQTAIANPRCPTVIVHPGDPVPFDVPSRRIVVGFDGSDGSIAALGWATELAARSMNPIDPLLVATEQRSVPPGVDIPVVDGIPGQELVTRSVDAAALVIGAHEEDRPSVPFAVGLGLWCASRAGCPTVIVPESWQPKTTD